MDETISNPRTKIISVAVVAALLAVLAGWYLHARTISAPVEEALAGEVTADLDVYHRHWLSGSELVVNVASVEGTASMVDVTRQLLKAAEALKDKDFDRVYLAYEGNEKFLLEGAYFKRLGEEREWQNPIYTIRTMPQNVMNLDGTPAFGAWSGGLIGVLGGQMDDNNEFHQQWWVHDALADLPS